MKRIIAGLALGASTLVTVAPAQAAPISPVEALEKQLAPGRGVRTSVTDRDLSKPSVIARSTGTWEFGKAGAIASDLTTRYQRGKGVKKSVWDEYAPWTPERALVRGGYKYVQGGPFDAYLPEGEKWIRYGPGFRPSTGFVDIFHAKQFRKLVADAKYVKGSYRGSITFKELMKLKGEKVHSDVGKSTIDYLLETDSRDLVRRMVSRWTWRFGTTRPNVTLTETRFTDWGAKVAIKTPPESEWIDGMTLDETPQDPANNSIDLLGQNR
ncbi:hypothetical protein LDL08_27130 [Nonomuraea glycinis]|uniref:Uncharacterized protein n=1 Tax=Nonomuraea glycinis TaxID=2047744 RepID=A0A918E7Y0_9ACTN|nr:hypothetical protein [Nonomuraea glycinis]MCA2179857.1 hypothetical protein [Nonomuraea glycinis]GGP10386.1 hypothetical protein GCM10012278_49810 [Nonomuraea glycinis]